MDELHELITYLTLLTTTGGADTATYGFIYRLEKEVVRRGGQLAKWYKLTLSVLLSFAIPALAHIGLLLLGAEHSFLLDLKTFIGSNFLIAKVLHEWREDADAQKIAAVAGTMAPSNTSSNAPAIVVTPPQK